MQINQEKLKQYNKAHANNQCYFLHDLMSSTNETQDLGGTKKKGGCTSNNNKKDLNYERFTAGRFTIKKYKLKESSSMPKFVRDLSCNKVPSESGDLIEH